MQAVLARETDPRRAQRLIQERFPAIGGNIKAAIRKAARDLGWTHSRAKNVWYQDARRIDGHEFQDLERVKASAWCERLLGVRQSMLNSDPEFYEEEAHAIWAVCRALEHHPRED